MKTIIEFKNRPFLPSDAHVCLSLRTDAFKGLFVKEIGENAAQAGIEAYSPQDIIFLAENNPFFVAETYNAVVGFIGSKIHDKRTIEILYLYVDLNFLNRGVGSKLLLHFEDYVKNYLPDIDTIILDTIIPKYNQKFYEKIGYEKIGESFCDYPSAKIRAVRLEKKLSRK
jgi:ribosomal protein S18 acetylase RimI-like enzyme